MASRLIIKHAIMMNSPLMRLKRLTAIPVIQSRGIRHWQEKTLRIMNLRADSYDRIPERPNIRSEHQEWNYSAELYAFNTRLGEKLNMEALKVCFTDKTFVHDQRRKQEELGVQDVEIELQDNSAVHKAGLEFMTPVIMSYLRSQFTHLPEEGIVAMHDYLMSEEVLADIAYWLGCRHLILHAPISPDPSLPIRAKLPPAIVGTIREHVGEEAARKFILDLIMPYMADKDPLLIWDIEESDVALSRVLANQSLPDFEARILRQAGVNTIESIYLIGIYVNKRLIGKAPGETVAIARRMAILDSLRRLFRCTSSMKPLEFGPVAHKIDLSEYSQQHASLKDWTEPINSQKAKRYLAQ